MFADSLLLPECVYRPGSFSGLMLLYESNYLKLNGLIGALDAETSHWISRARGDSDLYLARTQSAPYTTTVCMTYWLRDETGAVIKDPDMTIRIYHDAGQVEAVSCRAGHRHRLLRELSGSHAGELSRRWQINMMLNKWLDYLIDSGHGFA
jgi:uncharacterized protein YqiB (DUF1249 family)